MLVLNEWWLTAERVAVHRPSRTAVVADLHLGYAEARRHSGEAVPKDDDVPMQLAVLGEIIRRHAARRLVVAGDLLEHPSCRAALAAFLEWLHGIEIEQAVLVPGNHDNGQFAGFVSLNPPAVHGEPRLVIVDGFDLDGWHVVHGDGAVPKGPVVQGHEHPFLRWAPPSRVLRPRVFGSRNAAPAVAGACYLVGSQRLVLPAFSRESAGVNVLAARRWRAYHCCVIAGERVLDLGEVAGLGRRLAVANSLAHAHQTKKRAGARQRPE